MKALVYLFGIVLSITLVAGGSVLATDDDKKVTICHRTGSQTNPTVTITVSENAWEAHKKHGDTKGPCSVPTATPTRAPTSEPTARPTATAGVSGTPKPTATGGLPAGSAVPPRTTAPTVSPANKAPVKTPAPKVLPNTSTY